MIVILLSHFTRELNAEFNELKLTVHGKRLAQIYPTAYIDTNVLCHYMRELDFLLLYISNNAKTIQLDYSHRIILYHSPIPHYI
ncbi:hypothetical protein MIJ3_00280 [Pseudomonas phage vB_PaeM_MIJ3]|uniref:Uncharacterized protein n=1 Tax=Pseudomonas phage vB_PaeM_PA5oct TaxID=2163605 RepID=A0A4Y5JWI5_9CAUD|nr:hypothetical protein PQE65_gp044 [Pseudomonas phage vB_PaeM_PA5oct]QCG76321.1 hypothetical protein EST35_0453 [Pseudomonas phage vB_PaeM_PA5oct]WMI31972.1 hypothetical protein GBBBJNDB_00281 [Pseudomonas phage Callisto]VOH55323.1 hypothetical protein MIJ3_00280 [Pseudomonas phage vB_PaeM_MIJ3]